MSQSERYNPGVHLAEFLDEFPEYEDRILIIDPGRPSEENARKMKTFLTKKMAASGFLEDKSFQETVDSVQERFWKDYLKGDQESNNQETKAYTTKAVHGQFFSKGNDRFGFHVVLSEDTRLQPVHIASFLTRGFNGYHSGFRFPILLPVLDNDMMWHEFITNHELGHVLTHGKKELLFLDDKMTDQARECAADAYAMMRHFQRYGSRSTFPQYFLDVRTLGLVHTSRNRHFTSDTLEEVIRLGKLGKLQDLSPQETVDLAVKIGRQTVHEWDVNRILSVAFEESKKMACDPNPETNANGLISTVRHVGLHTRFPAVRRTALRYFDAVERRMPSDRFDAALLSRSRVAVQEKARKALEAKFKRSKKKTIVPPRSLALGV